MLPAIGSPPDTTYTLTPIGEEFGNSATLDPITTFESPGTFSLTVTAVPEPSANGLAGIAKSVVLETEATCLKGAVGCGLLVFVANW